MSQSFLDRFLAIITGTREISKRETERVIALAGIFQAAALVKQWAHQGKLDEEAFETQLKSVLELSPATATDIYGDLHHMQLGLKNLLAFFTVPSDKRDKETAGYAIGLIVLQRKLAKSPQLLEKIRSRIPFIHTQIAHYGLTNPIVISNLADIYMSTLSQFNMRIQVKGAKQYLESDTGINTVRALLLTGIRFAVLWQQLGGEFYHLFLTRSRIARVVEHVLNTLPPLPDKDPA